MMEPLWKCFPHFAIWVLTSVTMDGFICAKNTCIISQPQKAMYSILRKSRKLGLPLDLQFQLFDAVVSPILLYASEIWGHEDNAVIEKLHLRFCRILLNVNSTTAKCMVCGELGRHPMQMLVDQRLLNYWAKIVTSKEKKLNKIVYQITYHLCRSNVMQAPWIQKVKELLNECDLYNLWLQQNPPTNMKHIVKGRITDIYVERWKNNIFESPKCYNYRMYKNDLIMEKYLLLLPLPLRISFTRFRVANHKLPIEKGRFENIPRHERKCSVCDVLGDEFHYLFMCPKFKDVRSLFLGKFYSTRVNVEKYKLLMSTSNIKRLCKIAKFAKYIMKDFS